MRENYNKLNQIKKLKRLVLILFDALLNILTRVSIKRRILLYVI
jgi:hypothetical protein